MIALSHPVPQAVRQGQTVIVSGRANRVRAARIELEGRRLYVKPAGRWRVLVVGRRVNGGRFELRWTVPRHYRLGPIALRVVAVRARRIVAASPGARSFVGPAPVYCAPPTPPSEVPSGDGWITGGDYIEGGPYPGVYQCVSQPYTITATDQAGNVVATQHVAGGHSYTLVLPAGRYSLKASSCGFGSATVAKGEPTKADVVCPVP